jgi:hypothetical protein
MPGLGAALRAQEQAVALAGAVRAARRAYGGGPVRIARRARTLRRRQGFEYGEALRLGLLDPALPDAEAAGYVSRHTNTHEQRRLNAGEDSPVLVSEKTVFYLYCEAHGLRTPRLLAIIPAGGTGWVRDGRALEGRADWERAVREDLPSEWVVKPSEGYGGRSVRVLTRVDGLLADPSGATSTPGEVWDAMRADPEFDAFLVQERLRNHDDLAQLGGHETLHTVRIVTLLDRAGRAEVLWAGLKLGLSGSGVDNIRKGVTGNASCPVDHVDGRLGRPLVPRADGLGFEFVDSLPGGVRTEGVRLPDWPEAVELVLEAAPRFPPLRTLGWDVAITPDGPAIVEGNAHWGPEESPRMGRVFERMRMA